MHTWPEQQPRHAPQAGSLAGARARSTSISYPLRTRTSEWASATTLPPIIPSADTETISFAIASGRTMRSVCPLLRDRLGSGSGRTTGSNSD